MRDIRKLKAWPKLKEKGFKVIRFYHAPTNTLVGIGAEIKLEQVSKIITIKPYSYSETNCGWDINVSDWILGNKNVRYPEKLSKYLFEMLEWLDKTEDMTINLSNNGDFSL